MTAATRKEYDSLGQVIATRSYSASGTLLTTSRTTYTADGKVKTSWDALNNPTQNYYDVAGRSVRTVSPDGTSSETLYDAAGRVYLTIDRHVASTRSGLYGTHTIYDSAGRSTGTERLSGITLTITADEDKHQATLTADTASATTVSSTTTHYASVASPHVPLGSVDYTISEAGQRTEYLYDDAGRQWKVTQKAVPTWNPTTDTTDATDLVTEYHYDGMGRQDWVKDPKGHQTTTVYNDRGQVDRTVYADGSFVAYGYDAMGRKAWQSKQLAPRQADDTKPGYETPEQFQARIDASKTAYEYSDLGQLTAVVLPAVPDPENAGAMTYPRYEYTYNRFGQQETQKDAKGRVTRFEYDPLTGQQTARVLPLGQREETHYDELGRTDWTRDLAGRTTVYGYDQLGRLQTKTFFAAGKDPAKDAADASITQTYNAMGQLEDVIDTANGTTHYEYDAEGRQTLVASPQGTIHYRYDDLGRLKRTFTSNTDTRYTFDELGRLETVTMTLRGGQSVSGPSLSWYGQTISGETTRYQYDPVGNLDLIRQSDGVVSDYTYDDLNRLTDLVHFTDVDNDAIRDATEPVLASFHYDLNADGNKASATETDDQNITRHFVWKYDANDRLISESLDSTDAAQNYITRYTMDLVGNRLKQETDNAATAGAIADFTASGTLSADEVTDSTYDANDRIQTEKHDAADDTKDTFTQYAWNAGDQTGKTVHSGLTDQGTVIEQTTFEYNVQGRTGKITVVKDGKTTEITYKYNPEGIRVEEATTVDGTTTTKTYLVDSSNFTGYAQVLEEFVDGQLAKTFTLGHDVITQADATNGPLTFLYDGHGSTRALLQTVNGVVCVLQRYAYQAYGQQIAGQGMTATVEAALTALLYSGEMTDKFGRQNLRDRIYDVGTGRFTQSDRVSDPQSLHRYLYTGSNPINRGDPSGQSMLGEVMMGIGIGAAVGGLLGAGIGAAYGAAKFGVQGAKAYAWNGFLTGLAIGGALGGGVAALGPVLMSAGGMSATQAYAVAGYLLSTPLRAWAWVQFGMALASGDKVDIAFSSFGLAMSYLPYACPEAQSQAFIALWSRTLPFVRSLKLITAATANDGFGGGIWEPPYAPYSMVAEFEVAEPVEFVTFWNKTSGAGPSKRWMVLASDVIGKTPEEIRTLLAVEKVPDSYCTVRMDVGSKMRMGRVGPQNEFPTDPVSGRGGTQFQSTSPVPTGAYGPEQPLGPVFKGK